MKLVTAMLALILISAGSPGANLAESDQRAVDIAHATMQAMGGRDAMDSVRVLRFDWAVERDGETLRLYSHWWDRYTGDYRVDGKTSEGASIRALFNINTRQGDVWVGGQQLEEFGVFETLHGQITVVGGNWCDCDRLPEEHPNSTGICDFCDDAHRHK